MESGNRQSIVPGRNGWNACESLARTHGRTFYFASRWLPTERRRGALAAYAYCRIADDIVDAATHEDPLAVSAALAGWEVQLTAPEHPVAIAFAATRSRFSIPDEPARELLAGIRMDLTPARYDTWADLRSYCYHVAGTVGLMVAPILGCRDPHALVHAAELGIAMQLTNILRDVGEDAQLGRLYLPLDEIAAYGCDPESILAGRPEGAFAELMAFQIERARGLYASAMAGISALAPSGRFTTLAAAQLYGGILGEIEALNYDVFRSRAHVSTARKVRTLPGVASAFMRHSAPWSGVRPDNTSAPAGAQAVSTINRQSYG